MMSFPNRDDGIKSPMEGLSHGEGAKVVRSISAGEMSGNASCEVRGGRARRGSSMTNQCKFDSGNYLFTRIAEGTYGTVMCRMELSILQNPGLQRKRTEYSTVSLNWEGRDCMAWRRLQLFDMNRSGQTASPVSCRLYGMKAMEGNSGDHTVSLPDWSGCIKCPDEGHLCHEGVWVAPPISVCEVEGDALCEVGGVRSTFECGNSTSPQEGRQLHDESYNGIRKRAVKPPE